MKLDLEYDKLVYNSAYPGFIVSHIDTVIKSQFCKTDSVLYFEQLQGKGNKPRP